ncbi:MAG: transporter substrate-binding domain-containing protein [Alphaproteobacteria bacterium]|nr:transporter substrate-binding domain-containing protein [Alphaproteobacteria bacterium]
MKKIYYFMLLYIGCSLNQGLSAQELYSHRFGEKGPPIDIQRVIDRGRLVVAMHKNNYAPFFSDESGTLKGFDVDLAYDIAKTLNIPEVEFNRTSDSFDDVVKKVSEYKADMAISYVSKTLTRQLKVLYTEPYIKLRTGILVSRSYAAQNNITEKNLLMALNRKDATFAAERGGAFREFTRNVFPEVKLIEAPSRLDIYKSLVDRKIDAVYNEEYLIKVFFKKNPGQAIYYKPIYLENSEDHISIAIPPDAYNLKEWLNLYLTFRREKVAFDNLYDKYVTSNVKDLNGNIEKTNLKPEQNEKSEKTEMKVGS